MEEIFVKVKPQEKLPKINEIFEGQRAISGENFKFKVKKIVELRWNVYGELVVVIQGKYQ